MLKYAKLKGENLFSFIASRQLLCYGLNIMMYDIISI